MDILYSQKTRRLAASYSLQPDELAFADLIAAGWDKTDAYFTALRMGDTWTKQAVDRAVRELCARNGVKKRIKDLRYPNTEVKPEPEDEDVTSENVMNKVSKEQMLLDLATARSKMKFGSKEWLDTNKMIADITRMKQEEIKTEDNTVHYYLPITCKKCSLYIESKRQ